MSDPQPKSNAGLIVAIVAVVLLVPCLIGGILVVALGAGGILLFNRTADEKSSNVPTMKADSAAGPMEERESPPVEPLPVEPEGERP